MNKSLIKYPSSLNPNLLYNFIAATLSASTFKYTLFKYNFVNAYSNKTTDDKNPILLFLYWLSPTVI